MKNQIAFTLIELMVVIALIAILAAYAIPNMRAMLINNRIVTKTNELVHAINYARSEAITDANKLIQVRAIDENWSNGWEILDTSTISATNPDDTVLKVFKFNNDQIDVSVLGSTDTSFNYTSRGYLRTQIIFNICNIDYPTRGRRITVKQTGRANTQIRECN